MKTILSIALGIVCATASVHADSYKEAKTMGGVSKTWISGLKQRMEMPNLMGSSMLTITRVDKGVQWNIDVNNKVYEEKPIALPYQKQKPDSSASEGEPSDPELKNPPKLEINKLPESRTIAGLPSTGYEIKEASKKGSAIWWMTPATGVVEKVQKEQESYDAAYQKKLLENYPASEQKETVTDMKALGKLFNGQVTSMFKTYKNLPSGFMVSMEGIGDMPGAANQKMTIFEIQNLSADPVDAALFEPPTGFQKVESIAQYQMKDMMKGVNLEELMKKIPQQPQDAE